MLISNINFPSAKQLPYWQGQSFISDWRINYENNSQFQPIKKIYIYWDLMNRESENMGLDPYNVYPEYSVEENNSRQQLIAQTTWRPSSFPVQLQSSFRTLTTHL